MMFTIMLCNHLFQLMRLTFSTHNHTKTSILKYLLIVVLNLLNPAVSSKIEHSSSFQFISSSFQLNLVFRLSSDSEFNWSAWCGGQSITFFIIQKGVKVSQMRLCKLRVYSYVLSIRTSARIRLTRH